MSDSATSQPASFKAIGAGLAICSGFLIGSSFVLKKKGLLYSQKKSGSAAGEGHSYLKSWLWWSGMIMMTVGELLNLAAFSFASPTLVAPLGAISVVVSAVMSSIFLKETLTFFGKLGVVLCLLGATIVGLNAPDSGSPPTILAFRALFIAPAFLAWAVLVIIASVVLIVYFGPRYGKTHMLVYISICSLIGGLSVACTQGLGASILTTIRGESQFHEWFTYVLLAIVVVTLLTELNYLNKALELFNSSMVVPTYFVTFTSATLITSLILAQGFKGTIIQLLSLITGFFVIVCGITLLQLSKIDPKVLSDGTALDRKSTLLLKASRSMMHHDGDAEKGTELEDPGIDALRGGFGAIGSIHRAISSRRSLRSGSIGLDSGSNNSAGIRRRKLFDDEDGRGADEDGLGLTTVRHQLYDAPMPRDAADKISLYSTGSPAPDERAGPSVAGRKRGPTISFANEDDIGHDHQFSPRLGQVGENVSQGGLAGYSDQSSSTVFPPPRTDSNPSASQFADPDQEDRDEFRANSRGHRDWNQGRPSTLPKGGGGGGPNLAAMLSNHFSSSSPALHYPNDQPLPSPNRRFVLPGFPRMSSDTVGSTSHRDARMKGPSDLDEVESRSLVQSDRHDDDQDDDIEDEVDRSQREAVERNYHARLPSRGSLDD